MLDSSQPIPIHEMPCVQVYRDDRRPDSFYAYSTAPHVTRDADGAPAISVLFYGKKFGDVFHLTGGFLNLSTSLDLSAAEAEQLRLRLQEHLRQEQKLPNDAPPVPVELNAPVWTSGSVTVRLGAGLDVELEMNGVPSLIGANEVAFGMSLDAHGARQLQRLWQEGLPDATILYDLQTLSAQNESYHDTIDRSGSASASGSSSTYSVQSDFNAVLTRAVPFSIRAEGPLDLSGTELRALAQEIDL